MNYFLGLKMNLKQVLFEPLDYIKSIFMNVVFIKNDYKLNKNGFK